MKSLDFCEIFEEVLGEYNSHELSPVLTSKCDQHLKSCSKCAVLKAEYEVIIKLASQIKTAPITNDIRSRLRDRLEDNLGVRFAM